MQIDVLQSETDEALMEAVARKQTGALRELMRRHEARIRRLAYRFTGSDDAARELTQDVFFKVYTAAGSYSPSARFSTWLYRIAANHCLNYVRDSRQQPLHQAVHPLEESGHAAPGGQLDMLERHERAVKVRAAIDRLPERQRMAVLLLRFEEMSYKETAAVMKCSVSALEALVQRGFESLRKELFDTV